MNDPSAMHSAESGGQTNGESEEDAQLHRRRCVPPGTEIVAGCGPVQEPREWLTLLVFENQGRTPLVLRERERPQRPRRIEIVPESQFMFQHPHVSGQWMLRCQY